MTVSASSDPSRTLLLASALIAQFKRGTTSRLVRGSSNVAVLLYRALPSVDARVCKDSICYGS